jgi:hypothetical protein
MSRIHASTSCFRLAATLALGTLLRSRRPRSTVSGQPQRARIQRKITLNGGALDECGWRVLEQLEALGGARLPNGDYWYDAASGVPDDGTVRRRYSCCPARRSMDVFGTGHGRRQWPLHRGLQLCQRRTRRDLLTANAASPASDDGAGS